VAGRELGHHGYSFAWRNIIAKVFGHRPRYLIARNIHAEQGQNGTGKSRALQTICGVLPLFEVRSILFGNALISVPYLHAGGIVASDEKTFQALHGRACELAEESAAKYVELRARLAESAARNLPVRTHKVAMRLELDPDPETTFKRF